MGDGLAASPFTVIDGPLSNGRGIQEKELYQEIEQVFHEKWEVTAPSGPQRPSFAVAGGTTVIGTNIHQALFLNDRQQAFAKMISDADANNHLFLATNVANDFPDFQDSGSFSAFLTGDEDSLWLLVTGGAGIRPRAKAVLSDPFEYRYRQAGDLFGDWLIEDLQQAHRFTQYTIKLDASNFGRTDTPNDLDNDGFFEGASEVNFVTAKAAHDAEILARGWRTNVFAPDPFSIHLESFIVRTATPDFFVASTSHLAQGTVSGLSTLIPHQGAFYVIAEIEPGVIPVDIGGELGITAVPRYVRMGNMTFGSVATHQFIWSNVSSPPSGFSSAGFRSIAGGGFFQFSGAQGPNDGFLAGLYGLRLRTFVARQNPLWTMNWQWSFGETL